MAGISVRNLDDDVAAGLRVRAAQHGRSMESEVRAILTSAIRAGDDRPNLAQAIHERFGPLGGVDLDIPPRNDFPRSPDFTAST